MNEAEIDLYLLKIGSRLKELRKTNGYSSYESFAMDNELDRKQYWRMENGKNITLKSLIKVLSIHQITLQEFFEDLH